MTAQFHDSVWYQSRRYALVNVNGKGLPTPKDFGMQPVMMSTGCYRGYVSEYSVIEQKLILTNMTVRAKDGNYRAINGVKPKVDDLLPESIRKKIQNLPNRYENLQVLVSFSGNLLTAIDFIEEMYVHLGFQRPTSYRTVIELVFDNAQLVSTTDHSRMMARIRDRLDEAQAVAKARGSRKMLTFEDLEEWREWVSEVNYRWSVG